MRRIDDEVLAAHHVKVKGEAAWRQRLRLLQALWRESEDLPIGLHRGEPLGSRIAMPAAEDELSNYLTETIGRVVRATLDDPRTSQQGKVITQPRIFNDLLSSQPLCFNLFGELAAEEGRRTATALGRHLWPGRVKDVDRIEFEHSPGRADPRYLSNGTAFDVYLEHTTPNGGRGFIGIEVKYHEDLRVETALNRDRIDEVAHSSGAFTEGALGRLRQPPLQQVWFDHCLALSMLQADSGDWETGLFVFLHPTINAPSYRVVGAYERHLADSRTFQRLTLEEFVAALALVTDSPWVRQFHNRYLNLEKVSTGLSEPPI